jgi:hypothetical protein
MPPPEDRAKLLRKDLATGVTRPALFIERDPLQRAITFHELRDTGLVHGRAGRLRDRHSVDRRAHGLQDDAGLYRARADRATMHRRAAAAAAGYRQRFVNDDTSYA